MGNNQDKIWQEKVKKLEEKNKKLEEELNRVNFKDTTKSQSLSDNQLKHKESCQTIYKSKFQQLTKREIFIDDMWKGKRPENQLLQEEQLAFSFDPSIYFSQPLDEEEEIIFQLNSRTRIENTYLYPFICIGLVSGKVSGLKCYGTGSLIAPNIVLTCAHNCFFKTEDSEIMDLQFSPAVNGKVGKSYKVKKSHYPSQYRKKGRNYKECGPYDFAVLELEEQLDKDYGYLGIDSSPDNVAINDFIELCGYPGDKMEAQKKTMWTTKGSFTEIDDDFIYYQIPTSKGQSGSPIFKVVGEEVYIVGIHIKGIQEIGRNIGVRFNEKRRKTINEWVGEMTGWLDLSKIWVDVGNMKLGNEEIKYLADEKWTSKLTKLYLGWNNITEKGIQYLSIGKWEILQELYLSVNNINDEGMLYLHEFSSLKVLWMRKCGITAKGIKMLTKGQFPYLQSLDLSWNRIGDEGISYLQIFLSLSKLNLWNTNLTSKGLQIFEEMPLIDNLKELNIEHNNIGNEGRAIIDKIIKSKGINIKYDPYDK